MSPADLALLATVRRGDHDESWHLGAAAVVTPEGRLVARLGDPTLVVCLRSAAKPFQALPLVEGGGADRFAVSQPELALICASHGGTPHHTAAAATLLTRGGFGESDLQCGSHLPTDQTAAAVIAAGSLAPGPLHNNCSGKHAGMLLACRDRGLETADYLAPDHPYQTEMKAALACCCGVAEEIPRAVDGCSAPTFFLPLTAVARGYAALADPQAAGLMAQRGRAATRILDAMGQAPEMVAGPGRFTTRLIAATGGRLIGKEGAEALYAVAVRGPVALGVVLKVADGSERCRDAVVLALLHQLGVLSAAELADLADLAQPALHNHRGLRVGEIRVEVELEPPSPY